MKEIQQTHFGMDALVVRVQMVIKHHRRTAPTMTVSITKHNKALSFYYHIDLLTIYVFTATKKSSAKNSAKTKSEYEGMKI